MESQKMEDRHLGNSAVLWYDGHVKKYNVLPILTHFCMSGVDFPSNKSHLTVAVWEPSSNWKPLSH